MLARQYNMAGGLNPTPLPISAVIQAANRFGCDIYIKEKQRKINVKCYDELQCGIQPQKKYIIIYFDGEDEEEADVGFQRLFGS